MPDVVQVVNWARVAANIGAGLCMGLGAIGPSLGQGFVGGKACEAIGQNPDSYNSVLKTMVFALAFAETSSIYAFVISLMLLLW